MSNNSKMYITCLIMVIASFFGVWFAPAWDKGLFIVMMIASTVGMLASFIFICIEKK